MKIVYALFFCSLFMLKITAQGNQIKQPLPNPAKKVQVVEVACGQCQFGLPGKSCDLAIRVNGKTYFVDGTGIDSQGDAHAADGFCNAIRKAEVQGEVVNNRYKVTYFKLLRQPAQKRAQKKIIP